MFNAQLRTLAVNIEAITGEWRDACSSIIDGETDFTVGNYRFIEVNAIDDVLAEELVSDEYVLGCFDARFLAGVTGFPLSMIEACQKAEAFAAIGEAIIKGGHVNAVARAYAEADGYGHHFNSYDGEQEEAGDYYIFRT